MKDDLNGYKNVYALGENAKVEVKIANASDSDRYTFSGYVSDSAGNSVKTISSTVINSTNSFSNNFQFTVDAVTFSYGTYVAYITVSKTGGGSITSLTTFQVQDWMLSVDKKTTNSGFESEYNTFPGKSLNFEAMPTYRANGSIIPNITSSSFNISIKDELGNVINSTNAQWNGTCGRSGCYEFSVIAPANTGKYYLYSTLSHSGDTQTDTRRINVINGVMSAQATDKDGNVKDLFGANEYVFLSLSAYNQTSSSFNITDAEVLVVSYMNGSEQNYTQVSSFTSVNTTNGVYEWAWNSTLQRIKIDTPKAGGLYNVYLFGNNRSFGAQARFIINPYDVCAVPKDSAATSGSGYYYVWQFKTADTIYFEIQLTQANNPTGRAAAQNGSNSSNYGMRSSGCNADTSTKQVVSNATITINEVKGLETGSLQNVNFSGSSCQASDTSGRYVCTIKPTSKWDGGVNIVKFTASAQDGTSSVFYGNFEARSFYIYGYADSWQNSPDKNITVSVKLYEAGSNWWGNYGSSGISGTVSVKRIEYMGADGEWVWPPVDSGYNVSTISPLSITSGSGSLSLPVSLASGSKWKTGNYRVVLQASTSNGDSDYGYAWFGVKLWDVYGQPIECSNSMSCNYKSYFNSKENITLFVTVTKAGNNWWYGSSYSSGQDIHGNISIGIKKIQDCRTWPCKELNSTEFKANTIYVNSSSPSYWNSNFTLAKPYIIQINKTSGSWNTGWYSIVLNVNGTDTGYASFNTISFYVDAQPTGVNGTGWKSTIRGSQVMYFNISTTNNYKWGYASAVKYNESDYVNTTVSAAILRLWDSQNLKTKEINYPADFNISPTSIKGNSIVNLTYNNGSWNTGYYWGELTLNNSAGETSTGWLWFSVQPFRVSASSTSYNVDSEKCINATLNTYDSDWSSSTPLYGNYSITGVYEDTWSGSSNSRTSYANYSINGGSNISSFNASTNVTICPSGGSWSGGSWGGYHYLNIVVKDNVQNDTQTGWLSFKTVPFTVSWIGGGGYKMTNANFSVNVSLATPAGSKASGNLTKLYQWRYENYQSTKEEYRFTVNSTSGFCDSAISGQCTINGSSNITVYAPSSGWRVGWNYIQSEWTKSDGSTLSVQDYSGISFEGRGGYSGSFSNTDSNGNWKSSFSQTENITIKLSVQKADYSNASGITVTSVQYSNTENCWTESCRAYTSATFSPSTIDSGGVAYLQIKAPSTNWSKGDYYIKAAVSGSEGTATITGGSARVKDFTSPNVTSIGLTNNATYNTSISFSAVTSKNAQCSIYLANYGNFHSWSCSGWNSTSSNSTNFTAQALGACNITKYAYSGATYRTEYISNNYHSYYDGSNWTSCWTSGSSQYCNGQDSARTNTYMSTGGTSHTYSLNLTGLPAQHYGLSINCYDSDYNSGSALAAFKINNSI